MPDQKPQRRSFADILKRGKPPDTKTIAAVVKSADLQKAPQPKEPVETAPTPVSQPTAKKQEQTGRGRRKEDPEPATFDLVPLSFKYSKEIDYALDDLTTKFRRENPDKQKGHFSKKRLVIQSLREFFKKNGVPTENIDRFLKEGLR